ncbi:MAG: hypothetical protein EPN21_09840 [Methylococcaceae bacterium]|nr:MAG: hypothetical protein EPN21_09840 [Methylococcaceae bacterium]
MNLSTAPRHFQAPEQKLPHYTASPADAALLQQLRQALATGDDGGIAAAVASASFPATFQRLILILYAPGHKRILVTRKDAAFAEVLRRLLDHPRRRALVQAPYRIQMDFVLQPPLPVDFYAVGMHHQGERHFEIGLDGLLLRGPDGKSHVFAPGDAYVRSLMSMSQLRDYLSQIHGEDYLRQARFWRFRSDSYISSTNTWLRLYRGHPLNGPLTKAKIEHALELAVAHIQRTQQADGRFLYYYDAAHDSRWDHEHPKRHPDKNPFYNILRHGGGGLTCLFYEKLVHRGDTFANIRRAIEFLLGQTRLQSYDGREGAYIYHEKKAKLGGSGIALYLIAEYELVSGDGQYRHWADKIAWHLLNQITAGGEFIYYNIYLDQPIDETQNAQYFSFYYPGEAVCGLAKYLHLASADIQAEFFARLHKALEFLIVERPKTRADQYTAVPSDSWLMMGIMELWDFPAMRRPLYADFVFADAQQMIDHLYKVTDAPYPDYAGAFYYQPGDYPYADGARCEGLLGAYELAVKMGDAAKAAAIWPALRLAAWAVLHLVNTEDSIYFAPNPDLALGGIRFKYTRQWFRIDTIQHVASFFAKLLPYWREP